MKAFWLDEVSTQPTDTLFDGVLGYKARRRRTLVVGGRVERIEGCESAIHPTPSAARAEVGRVQ